LHIFQSAPQLEFCTFAENTAKSLSAMYYLGGQGGAVFAYLANPVFQNCTFYANAAEAATGPNPGLGGGIFMAESSPVLERCIITGTLDGGAVHCWDTASHPTLLCCDLVSNAGGDWTGCITDQLSGNGNFSAVPRFCDTLQLDLSLQDNSPCLASQSPCGLLVGARDEGCVGTDVADDGYAVLPSTSGLRNFPNPFNTGTEIAFRMVETGLTRLEIFDVLGRRQATLLDGVVESGPHSIVWSGHSTAGRDLPSGVYFCRLQTRSSTQAVRLVILR